MLADTHALVWYLTDPGQLSPRAHELFADADRGRAVTIASVTLVELVYIAEKRRDSIDPEVVRRLMAVDRVRVRDPFDRTIVATAQALGTPLLTKDRLLRSEFPDLCVW